MIYRVTHRAARSCLIHLAASGATSVRLSQLGVPIYWIAGNHDDGSITASVFGHYKNLHELTHLTTPYWDFIALNSCREGTASGYIEPDEMKQFLARLAVAKQNKKDIVVVMHHHPVPIATPLVDECMLQDSEDFLRVLKGYDEIKLVLCGHVHGDYVVDLGGKKLEACPAISFQWKKGTSVLDTEDTRAVKRFRFEKNAYVSSVMEIDINVALPNS